MTNPTQFSRIRSRRGSALLIVLGMVAFMVVSAVAFSAYMRTSRLPSSYLRRAISSKMLVKAALANAIDEIDAAVGDFPHPGVWNDNSTPNNSANIGTSTGSRMSELTPKVDNKYHNYNTWIGRVYIGGNDESKYNSSNVQELQLEQNETVATLCLEALAYIPPPLVNEARYFSRHSRGGTWHSMGFDSGRYAFCALDVSDYFDINALTAGEARSSTPESRISLSYLFENSEHNTAANGSTAWDTFIQKYISQGVPLISIADWNLAMGSRAFGSGIKSHFCKFVGGNSGSFYSGDGETDDSISEIQKMTFVTDGWFPEYPGNMTEDEKTVAQSNGGDQPYDLTTDDGQPFDPSELRSGTHSLSYFRNPTRKPAVKLLQSLCQFGMCALWDYLDKDSIPVSLAIPTVERTPMIAALNIMGPMASGAELSVVGTKTSEEVVPPYAEGMANGTPCKVTRKVHYVIENIPSGYLKPVIVYPFRNKPDGVTQSYTVGGRLTIFLTVDSEKDSTGIRTDNSANATSLSKDLNQASGVSSSGGVVNNNVFVMPLRDQSLSLSKFKPETEGQKGAVIDDVELAAGGKIGNIDFLDVTYEWETKHKVDSEGVYLGLDKAEPEANDTADANCLFQPLNSDGSSAKDYVGDLKSNLKGGSFSSGIRLSVSATAWIKDDSVNKLVDLVPAAVSDDSNINEVNTDTMSRRYDARFLGGNGPVLGMSLSGNSSAITFNAANVEGNKLAVATSVNIVASPASAMCADPRYNHAPESWFTMNQTITSQVWLDNCHCADAGRDGDIFMQVSDQCYLQSIYELANLPRLTDFYRNGSQYEDVGNYANPNAAWSGKGLPTQFSETANHENMWKTYNPFPGTYLDDGDNFEDAGFTSAGDGFKVNPYSDSTNIIMAALANTPLEWAYAADSEISGVSRTWSGLGDAEFNRKYAWNDYGESSKPRVSWLGEGNDAGLEDVAGAIMHAIRTTRGAWQDAYADLPWFDSSITRSEAPEYLLSKYWDSASSSYVERKMVDASSDEKYKIYNCDRKFLYGYWHDCFDVKQQLYLIFVRAEPMLMGGGAINQTPPALGAKAMALVWRDPVKRSTLSDQNDYGSSVQPHRMRVLFYRQFD